MYVLGMVTAIIAVIVMRHTTMRGDAAPFIMELPAYHAPKFKSLMFHLWDKLKHYVKKAFTIILVSTIIIWFISSFKWDWTMVSEIVDENGEFVCYNINESILASVGQLFQPLFTPLGFGSQLKTYGWVFAVAAVTGLVAKENVIATFGVLAAGIAVVSNATGNMIDASILDVINDESGIAAAVQMIKATGITWPGLIAFIAFNMTTIPCFAAVATAKAELPQKKLWATILFWIVTSYLTATIVYIVLSWWWTTFIVIAIAAAAGFAIHYINKYIDAKRVANI